MARQSKKPARFSDEDLRNPAPARHLPAPPADFDELLRKLT